MPVNALVAMWILRTCYHMLPMVSMHSLTLTNHILTRGSGYRSAIETRRVGISQNVLFFFFLNEQACILTRNGRNLFVSPPVCTRSHPPHLLLDAVPIR